MNKNRKKQRRLNTGIVDVKNDYQARLEKFGQQLALIKSSSSIIR
ncbi:hypothetical protein [Salipaludibacillus sp. LMS25]|nr:hypothetical protein [Salipaludibacillus sp. LMS25]